MLNGNNKRELKPAVFLDRDGTVCEEVGYLSKLEKLVLIPGSTEAIKTINRNNYKVIIISNQSGVARGYFSEQRVQIINKALRSMLKKENAIIDGIYYCPHHPQGKPPYNRECQCRKPNSGLIYQAAKDHQIDIERSAVIGDKFTDVLTAKKLNIPGILIRTGFGEQELRRRDNPMENPPDFIAKNLFEAVEWWFDSK